MWINCRIGLVLGISTLIASTAVGQPSGRTSVVDDPPDAAVALRAVDAVRLADDLAGWGRQTDDPIVLVAAARLLLAAGIPLDDDAFGALAPSALLAEALAMDHPTTPVRAMVDDSLVIARNVVTGFTRWDGILAAGAADRHHMVFDGNALADVVVRVKPGNDLAADLDIRVFDVDGHQVAGDEATTTGIVGHAAYADWVPLACGSFVIEVTNHGTAEAAYLLVAAPSLARTCGAAADGDAP